MSFKNVILSSVAAVAIASTSAMAVVTLENDGTGDYLLSPATYATSSGWNTQLKVVNTNTTHAIVARVVVRNSKDSSELFDFPIYLTPSDAWEGTLRVQPASEAGNTTGADRIAITSSDDSSMIWLGQTGTILRANIAPITYSNNSSRVALSPDTTSTYVEVFALASYDAGLVPLRAGLAAWNEGTPLDKLSFFEEVREVVEGSPKTGDSVTNLYGLALDPMNDDILGKQVITNDAAKLNMALNMVALGEVATQPSTAGVIGPDTTMAIMSDKGAGTVAPEVEAVLSKNTIYVMNEGTGGVANPMRIHFTDPVKKYLDEATLLNTRYLGTGAIDNHYYSYGQVGHDMEENLTSCKPVGDNDDISGGELDTKDCNSSWVYREVQIIEKGGTGSKLPIDYMFDGGGFLTFTLDQNTSVIPTTFSSSTLSGSAVNYHISNQYKAGVPNLIN